MGLTFTEKNISILGNKRMSVFEIAFDSSYPTGGESLVPRNIGLSEIDILLAEDASGYNFEYDHTNKKILAYTAGSQVADTTNLSTLTGVRIMAIG
jgi:hypothetical protein